MLMMMIGLRLWVRVFLVMKEVCGIGLLIVLISSRILLIMDRMCLILLLKLVCLGVFIILID